MLFVYLRFLGINVYIFWIMPNNVIYSGFYNNPYINYNVEEKVGILLSLRITLVEMSSIEPKCIC